MSFVVLNVLTVPEQMRQTLEQRFAARAGEVDSMDGFEHFELLRPAPGDPSNPDRYLVYTRWVDRAAFELWMGSQAFDRGHAQASADGPAASASEVWTFEVADLGGAQA